MDRRRQGQAPFGFRWQGGELRQEPEEVVIVQEIFRAMIESGKASAVTKELKVSGHATRRGGEWSDVQVGRILRCSAAIGRYQSGKGGERLVEVVDCDAIVSREVWSRVQELLADRRPGQATLSEAKPETLAGLVWCGCGGRMDRVAEAGKFRCPRCRQSVGEDVLESVFAEDFGDLLQDNLLLRSALDERESVRAAAVELGAVESALAEAERDRSNAEGLFSSRAISLKRLQSLTQPLEVKLRSLEKKAVLMRKNLSKTETRIAKKSDWRAHFTNWTSEYRWNFMKKFLKRIIVDVEEIQLSYLIAEPPILTSPKVRGESQAISMPANQEAVDGPPYIRLPKPGTNCSITGLGRAKLNELILPNPRNKHRPPIKSVSLKQPGQAKGVRLIVLSSLLEYCRKAGLKTNDSADFLGRDDCQDEEP